MNDEVVHWVRQRSECTLDLTFKALWDLVQRDVREINEADVEKRCHSTFKVEQITGGSHPIFRVQRLPIDQSVFFHHHPTAIAIEKDGKIQFKVTPKWNDEEAQCDLFIEDKPYKLWQVNENALSDLFFQP